MQGITLFCNYFFPFHKEENHVKDLNIPTCKIPRIVLVEQIVHTLPFMWHHLNKKSFLRSRDLILSCPFCQCV